MHDSSDFQDHDAELRAAASDHRLWALATKRAESGDGRAAAIAETCARIHQATIAEADRLQILASTDVSVDPDPSGQLHLITMDCPTRESAKTVSQRLNEEGYVPWQALEGAAEEVFFRTNTQRTFVHLGDVTRTVIVQWPGDRVFAQLPEALRPTSRDWNTVALPSGFWWGYFALRPLRLLKERVRGPGSTPLPLGPILSTPVDLIDKLLEFAELGSDDHLVDLGCGDGRVLVRAVSNFGCRATGVEQDVRLLARARARVDSARLSSQIEVGEGDANTFDLEDATIVFLFIPAEHIGSVAESLRSRGFAGRIISHEQRFVDTGSRPSASGSFSGTAPSPSPTAGEAENGRHNVPLRVTPSHHEDGSARTMTLLWPSMTDYSGAIQNADQSFRLPALAGAEFETLAMMGLPAFASGQNAVVFSARIGKTKTAVRCFTSPSHDGRRRYRALENHLRDHPVGSMAAASWVDEAIEVNGALWPIVTMDWIEGFQLHDWVKDNVYDSAALTKLADSWIATCTSLREAAVTHGDLQHGNVLVDPSGSVRLIDFDGVWLPEIDDSPPSEVGHPNYQHPDRSKTGAWGWSIDWFSALSVLVSLRALAADPSLWELHNGENLIFHESDYWGDAHVWNLLERSPDNDVVDLAKLMAEGCGHPCDSPYDLPTIVQNGLTAVMAPPDLSETREGSRHSSSTTGAEEQPPRSARTTGHTSSDPSSERDSPASDWWFNPRTESSYTDTPPPRAPTPESSPAQGAGDVNFVWVTGPSQRGAGEAPPSKPPPHAEGVRPPERERPSQQSVQSDWNNAGSPPPPRPSAATPPPPGSGRVGTASRSNRSSAHVPPGPTTSGSNIAGYIAIVLIFLVVGILIGALAGGF